MAETHFDDWVARRYERLWPELFEPTAVDPVVELSPAMVARLRAQPGADAVGVTVGDFARTAVGGTFSLIYLLRNTITNLTTQDEQVECFGTAAGRLAPGGRFVIENYVPGVRRLPPGETVHVFARTLGHLGSGRRSWTSWPGPPDDQLAGTQ